MAFAASTPRRARLKPILLASFPGVVSAQVDCETRYPPNTHHYEDAAEKQSRSSALQILNRFQSSNKAVG
jgi:hypothetical protein